MVMTSRQTEGEIVPFPPLRHLMTDRLELEHRRHTMHGRLEVDVTDARRAIRTATRVIAVAVLVSAALLVACSSKRDATSTPLLAGTPMSECVIKGEVPVKAEMAGFCGTLQVPEDRSNPSGRHIGLNVAVVPARAAVPAPDPLFAIAGGPGEASTRYFAWLPSLYTEIHATRDIVLVDQRGTGASHAITLPEMPDTAGLSASAADARLAAWAHHAVASLDADPRFYTTTVAADDLDDVRAALGYDRINIYGTSYGGTLAQYYLRQHGEHVRVAVLDGATPLDVPVRERIAANSQHALDLLLARCAADPACRAAFPDLATEWSTLAGRLATGVTVVNPDTGEQAALNLAGAGASIHHALLTGATAAQLPLAIHLAYTDQLLAASRLIPPPPVDGVPLLMSEVIFCSEAWARFDSAEVARTGAGSYLLESEIANATAQATVCRYLPKGVVPADDAAPVRTTVPILWLTGDGDPQDPPANLTSVPSQQPNSRILVMPAQHHVVGHLGCGPTVIAAFLNAGTANGLDTACIAKGAAPTPTFGLP
jgi:pimeloyl-ACP methyl ester carboxylesterase